MAKPKGIREIQWGTLGDYPEQTCIYDNGHIEPSEFLQRVREWILSGRSDFSIQDFDKYTVRQVKHMRFRPLSPSEAKNYDIDYGVQSTRTGGYPVTCVFY